MNNILQIIFLLALPWHLWAQMPEPLNTDESFHYNDLIIFKNGYKIKGEVLSLENDFYLVRVPGEDKLLEIGEDKIRRIIQKGRSIGLDQSYPGYYISPAIGINTNTVGGENGSLTGLELSGIIGYQYSRWIGGGIGMSVISLNPDRGETLFPVFAEYRGYWHKSGNGYFTTRIGHALAFDNLGQNVQEAIGGFMVNPNVGFKFGQNRTISGIFEIGVLIQNAEFMFRNGSDRSFVDLQYRRLTARFGLIL